MNIVNVIKENPVAKNVAAVTIGVGSFIFTKLCLDDKMHFSDETKNAFIDLGKHVIKDCNNDAIETTVNK